MFVIALAGALAFAVRGNTQVALGMAADFGILANTAITNTGPSVVIGDIGITPNGRTSITGFPPGVVTGAIEAANARAMAAHDDAVTAYTAAAASMVTTDLTGQDLGGKVLPSGVFSFSSSAGLVGVLTLDGQGDPDSTFVFKIGSTLITATAASVVLVNGARPCNVYFQVGSSATMGTDTKFAGSILALTSITANSGVTVNGGIYALNAAVTLISDNITAPGNCSRSASSSALSSVSNTAVQSDIGTNVPTNTVSVSGAPSAAATASMTETGTSSSRTTLATSTITKAASESGKAKSTKTKNDKTTTKTLMNCACRGENKADKTCVCQGSDKGETEEDE